MGSIEIIVSLENIINILWLDNTRTPIYSTKKEGIKMTQTEKEDYLFHKHFTDEDWKNETDIERLLYMALNWKMFEGKWSDIAEGKMNYVKSCELTDAQKVMFEQLCK